MHTIEHACDVIRQNPGALFILCGLPYAGKSSVAERLLSEATAVHISIDKVFHDQGFDWATNKLPTSAEWETIFDLAYADTHEALSGGKTVLFDSTNHTRANRDRLREIARAVGVPAFVLYVQTTEEEVWRNWEENKANPTRSVVDRGLVAEVIRTIEPPTADEHVMTIQA